MTVALWKPSVANWWLTIAPVAVAPSSNTHAYVSGSLSGSVPCAVKLDTPPMKRCVSLATALTAGGRRAYSNAPRSIVPLTGRARPFMSGIVRHTPLHGVPLSIAGELNSGR